MFTWASGGGGGGGGGDGDGDGVHKGHRGEERSTYRKGDDESGIGRPRCKQHKCAMAKKKKGFQIGKRKGLVGACSL